MEHLYAPWRMEYIGGEPEPGCLFCRALADPEAELVVDRPPGALLLLNKFPYNSGHVLVAPAAHKGDLTDLDMQETAQLMAAVQLTLRVLRQELRPEGFNVGVNLGRVAGAGVPDHVHFHVVPRWNGDTNFMPVLAEVKVVNEHLTRTAEKLRQAFAAAH
ncbi:MAG: HIT domain-containing protein [Chloroflexi bacterium]|nr:MAG: HIT domain-containing protein [Chloroflexota bacterium]